jgi:hypothetical protein
VDLTEATLNPTHTSEKASTGPCRNIPETIDNSFSTSSGLISSFRNSLTESLSFQKSAEFKPISFFLVGAEGPAFPLHQICGGGA